MSLSLVSANLAWQEAKIAMASLGAKGVHQDAFRALKAHLSQLKANPNLQFVPITATSVDDASWQILADVPCKLYGVFLKKQATDTDVFLALIDDATDDTLAAATTVVTVLPVTQASEQMSALYPDGLAMTVGVVAKAYTEFDGTTDSSSADTPNGFIIIGAA